MPEKEKQRKKLSQQDIQQECFQTITDCTKTNIEDILSLEALYLAERHNWVPR